MHRFRSGKLGFSDAYFTQMDAVDVTVVLTGVGPAGARREAANAFRDEFDSINLCVSSGLAGALRPEYRIGQVLAATAVVSESLRPNAATQTLASSGALLSFAQDCGASKVTRFLSADHVVSTAQEKEFLASRADAVEMESFEVLSAAADSGIPAIAIRSVSDLAAEDLPLDVSQVLNDRGAVSIPRVLGQVARRPQSIPGLMRLGKHSRAASRALARFLDLYMAAIVGRGAQSGMSAAVAGDQQRAS